jgi:hypothetical protein
LYVDELATRLRSIVEEYKRETSLIVSEGQERSTVRPATTRWKHPYKPFDTAVVSPELAYVMNQLYIDKKRLSFYVPHGNFGMEDLVTGLKLVADDQRIDRSSVCVAKSPRLSISRDEDSVLVEFGKTSKRRWEQADQQVSEERLFPDLRRCSWFSYYNPHRSAQELMAISPVVGKEHRGHVTYPRLRWMTTGEWLTTGAFDVPERFQQATPSVVLEALVLGHLHTMPIIKLSGALERAIQEVLDANQEVQREFLERYGKPKNAVQKNLLELRIVEDVLSRGRSDASARFNYIKETIRQRIHEFSDVTDEREQARVNSAVRQIQHEVASRIISQMPRSTIRGALNRGLANIGLPLLGTIAPPEIDYLTDELPDLLTDRSPRDFFGSARLFVARSAVGWRG